MITTRRRAYVPPAVPGNWEPNRPVGYSTFCEWDGSDWPEDDNLGGSTTGQRGMVLGHGDNQNNNDNNLAIVSPGLTLRSGPMVLQTTWSIGLSGQAPVALRFWAEPKTTEYSKIYLNHVQYIVGDPSDGLFERGNPWTKWGFVNYDQALGTGINQSLFTLGGGAAAVEKRSTFRPGWSQQNSTSRDEFGQGGQVRVDRVEIWESIFEINSANNVADGKMDLWITNAATGVSVHSMSLTDVVYRTSGGGGHKFNAYYWNPTFGGTGPSTRLSYAYFDHLLIAGVP